MPTDDELSRKTMDFSNLRTWGVAISLAAGVAVHMRARQPSYLSSIPRLDVHQLAYLSGGERRLTEVLLAELLEAGVVILNAKAGTLSLSKSTPFKPSPMQIPLVRTLRQEPRCAKGYSAMVSAMAASQCRWDIEEMLIDYGILTGRFVETLKNRCLGTSMVLFLGLVLIHLIVSLLNWILPTGHPQISAAIPSELAAIAIVCLLIFSMPLQLLSHRTAWGDHVLNTYQKRLSGERSEMAMAVRGLGASRNPAVQELNNTIVAEVNAADV